MALTPSAAGRRPAPCARRWWIGIIAPLLSTLNPACDRSAAPPSGSAPAATPAPAPSGTAAATARPIVGGGSIDIAGVNNVRAIGALEAQGRRHLRPQRLLRSGHLGLLNEEGYAKLVELGIASVVDLRSLREGKAAPDAPWVKRGTRHLTLDLPEVLPADAASFLRMLDALEPKLGRLFAHLGSPGALPVLIHCGSGKGRACVGVAVILLALGVSPADVARDFAENQTDAADPHLLDGLFARVNEAGGVEPYLARHSVSPSDLERLRSQALE